ncbi:MULTISPECIES: 4'-phosphopantetheinyl transferase family protein [unclassified Streptomyces]|uniref:4'-phosphopantetheinyl transferase family protein n=1 Tax=unclassified Streptomyces TaxID=2593676 RepID=UPI0005ED1F53|nr:MULTISPECIES: 4'-phosphopantetheinyl transferase superfamily protein [unclassified Streptomyces]APU39193.1 4'-phosphopantetheinyl transferase [Streptomyces sp. TN58]
MLELILPAAVACAESFADVPESTLFPEELEVLGAARHAGRRREFTTVRHCARRALADIGVPPAPVLPGERGAPVWPDGVVGSMTHSAGYRAAAVARGDRVRAVGIDAEPHAPLPGRTLGAVTLPEERDRLAALAADFPHVHWDRMLFCAKEAVYKAWFPMLRRRLGFRDASVTFDPVGGTFRARIVEGTGEEPPAPLVYEGRWAAAPELLLAAVVVPAGPATVGNRPDRAVPPTG